MRVRVRACARTYALEVRPQAMTTVLLALFRWLLRPPPCPFVACVHIFCIVPLKKAPLTLRLMAKNGGVWPRKEKRLAYSPILKP